MQDQFEDHAPETAESAAADARKKWLMVGIVTGGALMGLGLAMLFGVRKINSAIRDMSRRLEE